MAIGSRVRATGEDSLTANAAISDRELQNQRARRQRALDLYVYKVILVVAAVYGLLAAGVTALLRYTALGS